MEPNIGQYDSHQGYVGYVQPFGHDLRAHQDLYLTGLEFAHGVSWLKAATGGVRVPTLDADSGQQLGNLVHHPLSADSQLTYMRTAALPAPSRHPGAAVTPVAHQPRFG